MFHNQKQHQSDILTATKWFWLFCSLMVVHFHFQPHYKILFIKMILIIIKNILLYMDVVVLHFISPGWCHFLKCSFNFLCNLHLSVKSSELIYILSAIHCKLLVAFPNAVILSYSFRSLWVWESDPYYQSFVTEICYVYMNLCATGVGGFFSMDSSTSWR